MKHIRFPALAAAGIDLVSLTALGRAVLQVREPLAERGREPVLAARRPLGELHGRRARRLRRPEHVAPPELVERVAPRERRADRRREDERRRERAQARPGVEQARAAPAVAVDAADEVLPLREGERLGVLEGALDGDAQDYATFGLLAVLLAGAGFALAKQAMGGS